MLTLRLVIDTNVVFEGLTRQGGAAGLIIDAWLAGLLNTYVSNALGYEYVDVLSRKLSDTRWQSLKPVLGSLLARSRFVTVHYSWRPVSPDPQDDHVVDCAMNAAAVVVTQNTRHFETAKSLLGLLVATPVDIVHLLAEGD